MNTCPNCHQPVADDIDICPNCQTVLNPSDPAAAKPKPATKKWPLFQKNAKSKDSAEGQDKTEDGAKTAVDSKSKTDNKKTRREHRQATRPNRKHLTSYLRSIYRHIRNPFPAKDADVAHREFHGWLSLLLIAIFNTFTIAGIASYFINNYEWLANMSILPDLNFQFMPWLFAAQSFIFFIVSLWLLPALLQLMNKKIFKVTISNKMWLSHYFAANSLALLLSVLALVLSLIAPLLFFVVNVFLLLSQLIVFVVTTTIYILRVANRTRLPDYYWIIFLLLAYVIIEMILLTLIY